MLISVSVFIPLSVGGAGPAPPIIPQTFIDAHSVPGMMPGTGNAKMNETHYLTSGCSQGRGPIAESYEGEGQGTAEEEHSLGGQAGRLPRGATSGSYRMNTSCQPGKQGHR